MGENKCTCLYEARTQLPMRVFTDYYQCVRWRRPHQDSGMVLQVSLDVLDPNEMLLNVTSLDTVLASPFSEYNSVLWHGPRTSTQASSPAICLKLRALSSSTQSLV